MSLPFLDETSHHQLDGELQRLLQDLRKSPSEPYGALASHASAIIQRAEGKLVRPGWRETWRDLGCVTTAWFGNERHDMAEDALHTAFTALVRLVMDATTPYRKRQYA